MAARGRLTARWASADPGKVPIEMIGKVRFPPIGELPYLLTFAPHGFYRFLLTDGSKAGD